MAYNRIAFANPSNYVVFVDCHGNIEITVYDAETWARSIIFGADDFPLPE